jgi:hypothetical protein
MRQKGIWATVVLAVFLACASGLWAANNYRVLQGPDRLYFGHISYTEAKGDGQDPVVIREGQLTAEVAVLNLPLGPGDTVRTPADRRCEVQFDTGTVIRLDFDTELKIETINAQSLSASTRVSNLALSRGRVYVMYKEYDSREMFQLLTSVAALKMSHKTVATVRAASDGSTDVQVKYGKLSALLGRDERSLQKQSLKAQERLIVLGPGQSQRGTYIADSEFELWNNEINAHFTELHQDLSALPKPIQNLPDAVHYFAQTYGNAYGEWVWADLVGYVWRPYLNRMDYPGWRPYYVGSWTTVGGQLFWVPDEPWGWVPYHLGIWQWDKKLGWVWLPGSLFAPAWVDWEFYFGYFGWRPWGLYDWFGDFYLDAFYMGDAWYYDWHGFGPKYYAWSTAYYPGDPVPGPVKPGSDQDPKTAKGGPLRPPAAFPMPAELKGAYKNVMEAYKKGDPRVFEAMKQAPLQMSFVAKQDLNRSGVQGKTVSWAGVPKPAGIPGVKNPSAAARNQADPRQAAARAFRTNDAVQQLLHNAGVPGRVQNVTERPAAAPVSRGGNGPGVQPSPRVTRDRASEAMGPASHPRFLDWNPDMKVARSLGVNIEYSSRGNEVRCPELHLKSSDRLRGADSGVVPTLGRQGVSYESPGSAGVSGSGGSGGRSAASGPGSSAGGATGGASRGSGGEGSSGGGGGGKIKN